MGAPTALAHVKPPARAVVPLVPSTSSRPSTSLDEPPARAVVPAGLREPSLSA